MKKISIVIGALCSGLALCLSLTLGGCGGGGTDTIATSTTPTPSPSPSVSPSPTPSPSPSASPVLRSGISGHTQLTIQGGAVGTVHQPSTLPDAMAAIKDAATGSMIATVTSDASGNFQLDLPAGSYTVVPVPPSNNPTIVAGPTQTVTVVAGAYTPVTVDFYIYAP